MSRQKLSKGETIEVTQATLDRQNMALAINAGEAEAERESEIHRSEEQVERENQIAEAYQFAGEIRAFTFMEKVVTATSLMRLKAAKETKVYRDLPEIGTWEKYCDYLGLDRHTIDEKLRQLNIFGVQFLETCQQFSVSHRDLRKLRQLTHDGTVSLEGDMITIGDKTIPVDKDHADDIQDAIEWILTENVEMSKRVEKLEKDFKGAVKEETHGLHSEKKALLERVKQLEQFEPHEADREWSVKQMAKIEKAAGALQISITAFIIDPRLKDDRHLQAKVSAHLQEAELALQDARTRLDEVIDMFND